MQTNTSLTLYKRSVVNKAEAWTRVLVTNVHWENRKAANVLASGLMEADSISVFIPTYGRTVEINVSDVIVKGEVKDNITETFTMTDLRAKYSNVATVRSVDNYDFGSPAMRHLRIGAA